MSRLAVLNFSSISQTELVQRLEQQEGRVTSHASSIPNCNGGLASYHIVIMTSAVALPASGTSTNLRATLSFSTHGYLTPTPPQQHAQWLCFDPNYKLIKFELLSYLMSYPRSYKLYLGPTSNYLDQKMKSA